MPASQPANGVDKHQTGGRKFRDMISDAECYVMLGVQMRVLGMKRPEWVRVSHLFQCGFDDIGGPGAQSRMQRGARSDERYVSTPATQEICGSQKRYLSRFPLCEGGREVENAGRILIASHRGATIRAVVTKRIEFNCGGREAAGHVLRSVKTSSSLKRDSTSVSAMRRKRPFSKMWTPQLASGVMPRRP